MALQFAVSSKAGRKLGAEEISQQEAEVGGALSKAAHEIGEPVIAKGNVNAHAIAVFHKHALQVGAHAVKHLKLEIVLGNLPGGRPTNSFRNHARIVGSDPVVKAAWQENLHQSGKVEVDIFLARIGHVRQLARNVGVEIFLPDSLENFQVGISSTLSIGGIGAVFAKIVQTDEHSGVIAGAGSFNGLVERFAGDEAACHTARGAVGGDPFGEAGTLGELEKRRAEHAI